MLRMYIVIIVIDFVSLMVVVVKCVVLSGGCDLLNNDGRRGGLLYMIFLGLVYKDSKGNI